jgi:hypothetical protein
VISARAVLPEKDVEENLKFVEDILQSGTIPTAAKSIALANVILKISGRAYVEELLSKGGRT